MGEVYPARDSKLNREVAIKVLPDALANDPDYLARFTREAQVLASLNHPNIAIIHGVEDCALVMELVEGPTLADRIAAGPIPLDEALAIAKQIAEALEVAHERGIIHRDLKPANVKVTVDDAVKVLDFGLAKISSNETRSDDLSHSPTMIHGTQAGMILGTASYMSPEQAGLASVDIDTRTDIYSLGVLLYELLTSSTPFEMGELLKKGLDEIRRVIREQEPICPSTRLRKMTSPDLTAVAHHRKSEPPVLIRGIRGDLDWIVMKAIEKDRNRRYETADGLALDVQRYLAAEAVSAQLKHARPYPDR